MIAEVKDAMEINLKAVDVMGNFRLFLKKRFTKKDVLVDMAIEVDNILEADKLQFRASKNCFYRICLKVINSRPFSVFIFVCITANTLVLALDKYPIEKQ